MPTNNKNTTRSKIKGKSYTLKSKSKTKNGVTKSKTVGKSNLKQSNFNKQSGIAKRKRGVDKDISSSTKISSMSKTRGGGSTYFVGKKNPNDLSYSGNGNTTKKQYKATKRSIRKS